MVGGGREVTAVDLSKTQILYWLKKNSIKNNDCSVKCKPYLGLLLCDSFEKVPVPVYCNETVRGSREVTVVD
jgi:hypothetical protein